MRVLFICGSFELGKDGVGDYTRKLATVLVSCNHEAAVIAFNDSYIASESHNSLAENSNLRVFRIPSSFNLQQRTRLAKEWIESYAPTYISIQFVPFAYQQKGLPFDFAEQLKPLLYRRKVHIMFHELWTGVNGFTDVKGFITSRLQKFVIGRMIRTLQPGVMHTQLPHYKTQLEQLGFEVKSLPLFSNIEVVERVEVGTGQNVFRVGLFSQVSISESIVSFLKELEKLAEKNEMVFEILFIGGESNRVKSAADSLEQEPAFKNRIMHTGFLTPEKLSLEIQTCTLGLTPIPRHALGKSGSVAAFLVHGIPVAAPNIGIHYEPDEIGFFSESLKMAIVVTPDLDAIKTAAKSLLQAKETISVKIIADTFLSDLQRPNSEQPKKSNVAGKPGIKHSPTETRVYEA